MQKMAQSLLTWLVGLYLNLLSYTRPAKAQRLSYHFFSTPRYGRLSGEELPEMLQGAKKETLTYLGHTIQTYTWGDGPETILILHGWESNASRWEKLLPFLLAENRRIVAIDAPAHGLSSGTEFNVPLYGEFIEEAVRKYQPSILIGHSMGGIAMAYYLSHYHQHDIGGAVLLGSPGEMRTIVDNFYNRLSLGKRSRVIFEKFILDKFGFTVESFSARRFAQKIRIKALIGHDLDDDIVLIAEGREIANAWKHAIFVETKGFGHSMHDDALYGQIRDFLLGN